MSVSVEQTGDGDPMEFAVTVREAGGETRHSVTMTRADHERLAPDAAPGAAVAAAFAFLLDREPKESILRSFDVSVIARYFPEFGDVLPGYLAGAR